MIPSRVWSCLSMHKSMMVGGSSVVVGRGRRTALGAVCKGRHQSIGADRMARLAFSLGI